MLRFQNVLLIRIPGGPTYILLNYVLNMYHVLNFNLETSRKSRKQRLIGQAIFDLMAFKKNLKNL